MASRQHGKEARKNVRLTAEEEDRGAARRARRLRILGVSVAGAAAVSAIVVILLVSDSGDSKSVKPREAQASASLPKQQMADEKGAARAAGCELAAPADEGRGHEEKTFAATDYKVNPPTSGTHFPSWAQDGIYESGNTPALGELVHTLEHGRVNVQYKAGTSPKLVQELEALVGENEGYHLLLYESPTNMSAAVAATAWNQSLTCSTSGPKLWDALRTFRDAHLDRGPEKVA